MQQPFTREFIDEPGSYRHTLRFEGSEADIEALLQHLTNGEGYWCSDDEFASALAYIDDLPAVLEFKPEFYVQARFASLPFVVLRGERSATIVIRAQRAEFQLCRFLAAFHPDVYLVVIADEGGARGMWTGSFLDGAVLEPCRCVPVWETDTAPLLGLSDPEWSRDDRRTGDNFRDVGFPDDRTETGHIRVRGRGRAVQRFREELQRSTEPDFASANGIEDVMRMVALRPHTGCVIDEWGHDDLVIRFRFAHGLRGVARRWSRAFPDLDYDVVVTNRERRRRHTRFVDGSEMASETILVDEDEFDDAFEDDRYRRRRIR